MVFETILEGLQILQPPVAEIGAEHQAIEIIHDHHHYLGQHFLDVSASGHGTIHTSFHKLPFLFSTHWDAQVQGLKEDFCFCSISRNDPFSVHMAKGHRTSFGKACEGEGKDFDEEKKKNPCQANQPDGDKTDATCKFYVKRDAEGKKGTQCKLNKKGDGCKSAGKCDPGEAA
eukprot:gnl/MRDRNA2_/MRDRNA2_92140_c0_seq1.p1 gnl/MRDRNA2_/MRDRNA2_92140_c0~~gnl/MRDRNA2_/MRDRNA2_92140_c0_seq1.p1  ORF type:complete len:173 (+),score=32.93 gnl/MRDRNA2_/MRDRNA2_92140_c0_seq1:80-598(+)